LGCGPEAQHWQDDGGGEAHCEGRLF
jgi:hypothetical protein